MATYFDPLPQGESPSKEDDFEFGLREEKQEQRGSESMSASKATSSQHRAASGSVLDPAQFLGDKKRGLVLLAHNSCEEAVLSLWYRALSERFPEQPCVLTQTRSLMWGSTLTALTGLSNGMLSQPSSDYSAVLVNLLRHPQPLVSWIQAAQNSLVVLLVDSIPRVEAMFFSLVEGLPPSQQLFIAPLLAEVFIGCYGLWGLEGGVLLSETLLNSRDIAQCLRVEGLNGLPALFKRGGLPGFRSAQDAAAQLSLEGKVSPEALRAFAISLGSLA